MKFIISAILLLFCSSIEAFIYNMSFVVNPDYSGTWYYPAQDGHGFILQVIDEERTIGYWYTYDADGNQVWFLLDGVNETDPLRDRQIAFTAWQFTGMAWGDWNPDDRIGTALGTVLMEFTDCWDGVATWSLSELGSGSIPITHLSFVMNQTCDDLSEFAGDYFMYVDDSDVGIEITMNRDGIFKTGGEDGCPDLWQFEDRRHREFSGLWLEVWNSCEEEHETDIYIDIMWHDDVLEFTRIWSDEEDRTVLLVPR